MCFVNDDYEWTAYVSVWSKCNAQQPTRCDECSRVIEPGVVVHHLHQEESDECLRCERGDCDCGFGPNGVGEVEDKCCACPEPDFGRSFDYDRCDDCDRFLQAVEAAEVEAGCSRDDARPECGKMIEDIGNAGHDEAKRYFAKAYEMFPDIKPYLGRLWNDHFADDEDDE